MQEIICVLCIFELKQVGSHFVSKSLLFFWVATTGTFTPSSVGREGTY